MWFFFFQGILSGYYEVIFNKTLDPLNKACVALHCIRRLANQKLHHLSVPLSISVWPFLFLFSYHKQLCRKQYHQTMSWNNKAYKHFFFFHPLMCHNEDIVFCWLYWLCHPVSQWLSLCVFCSGMSWTHRATDSSSLDGEWPFLQPIRCHWAPLLWSQPFREDESH